MSLFTQAQDQVLQMLDQKHPIELCAVHMVHLGASGFFHKVPMNKLSVWSWCEQHADDHVQISDHQDLEYAMALLENIDTLEVCSGSMVETNMLQ